MNVVRIGLLLAFVGLAALPGAAHAEPLPQDNAAVLVEGRRLAALPDLVAAEALLRSAVERTPEDHDLLVAHGYLLFWLGLPPDALVRFDRALQLSPGSTDAQVGRAVVLASAGEFDAAGQQAVALRSQGFPEVDVRLLELRVRRYRGEFWGARRFAREIEALYGPVPEARALLSGPAGVDVSSRLGFETQFWGPLVTWGAELTLRPHELFRAHGGYEGSQWLGSTEHRATAGILLLLRSGVSFHVDLGFGSPGVRTPRVDLDLGAGVRLRRRVDFQVAVVARAYSGGERAWTLRFSASPSLGKGAVLDIGLSGTVVDLGPGEESLTSPGLALAWSQDLDPRATLRVRYGLGWDVYWDGVTRAAERAFAQRLELGLILEVHRRFVVEPSISLGRWGSRPTWYGSGLRAVLRL